MYVYTCLWYICAYIMHIWNNEYSFKSFLLISYGHIVFENSNRPLEHTPGTPKIQEFSFIHRKYMQCTVVASYYFALLVSVFWWVSDPDRNLIVQEMMKAATIGRSSEFGAGWEPPGMVSGFPVQSYEISWDPFPAFGCFRGHARSLHCWPLEVSKNRWLFSCWLDFGPLIWIWILCFMPVLLESLFKILHTDVCSALSFRNYHQGYPHEFASESFKSVCCH